jgi:hypothetical protein
MKIWRLWMAIGTMAWLAACGSGSEGDAPAASPAPAAPVPARAGAADIGPAGGTVDAVLEGGTKVELNVPAGAVAATTAFRIEPQAPGGAGALAAFTLSAGVEVFARTVTLTVTLAGPLLQSRDPGLLLATSSGVLPVGTTPDASGRIFASFDMLPAAPAALRSSVRALAVHAERTSTSERTILMKIADETDLLTRQTALLDAIENLSRQPTVDNAVIVQLAAESSPYLDGLGRKSSVSPYVFSNLDVPQVWALIICSERTFAVNALANFNFIDVPGFRRVAYDAAVWTLLARQMKATLTARSSERAAACGTLPDNFRQPVIDKLPDFIARLTDALNLLEPRTEYIQLLDVRLPEVLALEALMQQFDLGRSVFNLLEAQMLRMRRPAFEACQQAGDQDLQRRLLTAKVGNPAYTAVIPYSEADLRQDIEFCGMPLRWQLLNENRQVVDSGSAGGLAFGQFRNRVVINAVGTRYLVLQGPVRPLMCSRTGPDSGAIRFANNEQFVARVGPEAGDSTEVARVTPSNEQFYLQAVPLEFDLEALRSAAAAIQPSGAIRLQLQRSGDFCGDTLPNLTSHAVLATLILDFVGLSIDTTALPTAFEGVPYSTTVSVHGGLAPYAWSATGLPAGLILDAATGVISGTPTTVGNSTVQLRVTSADSREGSRTLPLSVEPPPVPQFAGTYAGQMIYFSGGGFSVEATVTQSVDRKVIAVTTLIFAGGPIPGGPEMGFELAANGALRFLGIVDVVSPPPRDGNGVPTVWAPSTFKRWEGTLVGTRLTMTSFINGERFELWEVTRRP